MDLILDPSGSRRIVEIAQLGPDFLITTNPDEAPPGPAEIVYRVDGRERRWMVYLPDGLRSASKVIRFVAAA